MRQLTFYIGFLFVLLFLSSFRVQRNQITKIQLVTQDELKGNELFVSKGCTLCHAPQKEIVGPSLVNISKAYKGDVNKVLDFMNGNAKPIVKPSEFQYMKSVLVQLKKMKKEEREALANYYMSFYKK